MKNKSYTDFPTWVYILAFIILVGGTVWLTCSFANTKDNGTPSKKEIHTQGSTEDYYNVHP